MTPGDRRGLDFSAQRQTVDAGTDPVGDAYSRYRPFHEQLTVELSDRRWPAERIETAPRWAAVDLRDGNQALIDPIGTPRKLELYDAGQLRWPVPARGTTPERAQRGRRHIDGRRRRRR